MAFLLKIRTPLCETLSESPFILETCEQLREDGKYLARNHLVGSCALLLAKSFPV